MTLHRTIEIAKKVLIGATIFLVVIVISILFFRFGVILKNLIFPPKVLLTNHPYGIIPQIKFPASVAKTPFTYTLNTDTGSLPDVPDRVTVFPIIPPQAGLLDLDKTRLKAQNLGFVDDNNNVLPEKSSDKINFEWDDAQNLQRKLLINIFTSNFSLSSDYLTSTAFTITQGALTIDAAINTTADFLNKIGFVQTDIDMSKTSTPTQEVSYFRTPQFFTIQNGQLVPTNSLETAHIIRIDLYQKDIDYTLNTGMPELTGGYKSLKMTTPILYPNPPYSTMNFWVAQGPESPTVVAANFIHQNIDTSNPDATYSIKTAQEAFTELKNGKAYIASYYGTATNIAINNIFLAYYLGTDQEPYLMPIFVFAGDNGFFAYVSAVKNEWVQ
ncbi:MAG TPA: hypothetical protein VF810_05045 [Patescibacteria group bacterium]